MEFLTGCFGDLRCFESFEFSVFVIFDFRSNGSASDALLRDSFDLVVAFTVQLLQHVYEVVFSCEGNVFHCLGNFEFTFAEVRCICGDCGICRVVEYFFIDFDRCRNRVGERKFFCFE